RIDVPERPCARANQDGPVLAASGLAAGGAVEAGVSGLITGDPRSLRRSFSTFEMSFDSPPRSVPGCFGCTGTPRSALGTGLGSGFGSEQARELRVSGEFALETIREPR